MKLSAWLLAAAVLLSLALSLQRHAPLATAEDPPPAGPFFQATIDETSPADPTTAPVDDDCPVGQPCKIRTAVAILPDEPALPIAGVTPGAFFVAPDAYVPNGLRVGIATFGTTIAVSSVGPCETSAIPYGSAAVLADATIDFRTSSGSPADLASYQRWPRQLNDELLRIAAHIPDPALWARYVGVFEIHLGSLEYYVPFNVLVLRAPDGSFVSAYLVGDPSARNADGSMQLGGPEVRLCSPFGAQVTIQGLAVNQNGVDYYPLRVCLAPGSHPFAAVFIPLSPTAGGPIVRTDPASCSGELLDSDGDGLPDLLDLCDDQPEDRDGIADRDGCPETDADGDGVLDEDDNCPQVRNPGQANNDNDSRGDACDPDDDNDGFPDYAEKRLGSNPLNAASTPEHVVIEGSCADGLDNDGDGASDGSDTGCRPFADFDGDRFPNVVEEQLGSDPNNPASTPEHFVLTPTCFDGADNDLDSLVDTQDPACFPFADSDGDGFIDLLERRLGSDPANTDSTPEHYLLAATCADGSDNDLDGAADGADDGCRADLDPDGDGFASPLELYLGSKPFAAASTPEHILLPETCVDGLDNDGDGKVDFRDSGCLVLDADGDGRLNHDDGDDDDDGWEDAAEEHLSTAAQQPCGRDGWPAELVSSGMSNNRVDILDLASFIAPVRRLGTNAASLPGNVRWDLVPGRGFFATDINVQDLVVLITTAPPMLNGQRAFNGPSCPSAP